MVLIGEQLRLNVALIEPTKAVWQARWPWHAARRRGDFPGMVAAELRVADAEAALEAKAGPELAAMLVDAIRRRVVRDVPEMVGDE